MLFLNIDQVIEMFKKERKDPTLKKKSFSQKTESLRKAPLEQREKQKSSHLPSNFLCLDTNVVRTKWLVSSTRFSNSSLLCWLNLSSISVVQHVYSWGQILKCSPARRRHMSGWDDKDVGGICFSNIPFQSWGTWSSNLLDRPRERIWASVDLTSQALNIQHQLRLNRMLWSECLCRPPPKFVQPNLNTQGDGIWIWGLGEVMRSWMELVFL